jgi:hypothetical protein
MAIEFSCQCGNVFRLDDEEAGAEIQCTQCGRLNDVPMPSDLRSIAGDGTFQLDEAPVLHDPKKAAELLYVYSRHEHDQDGYQKDLRLTDEEALDIGGGVPVPISGLKPTPHGPRYDPETGELIREIEIAPPDARFVAHADVPMAMATLSYATRGTLGTMSFTNAFFRLFQPGNLAVMGAIFVMHAISWPVLAVILQGIIFIGFAIPFFLIGMIGHYGNIVDDVGRGEHDELPRPLRDLHLYDDLWHPFCNVFAALLLSYFPMSIAGVLDDAKVISPAIAAMLSAILAGLGSFVFPAIFLTLQTSGTPVNLRPDRVFRVITISGPMYFVVTAIWIVAATLYSWGIFGPGVALLNMMSTNTPKLALWHFTVPILIGGIFMTHYFCYCLGLLYRAHHADFPWVLQRHIRTTPPGIIAPPRTPRRPPTTPRKSQ